MKTFMIRQSGIKEGQYYIDYNGIYALHELSHAIGVTENMIHHIYEDQGGSYDSDHHVYYFSSEASANKALQLLDENMSGGHKLKTLQLTEEEVAYLKQVLEDSTTTKVFTNHHVKSHILNKLG